MLDEPGCTSTQVPHPQAPSAKFSDGPSRVPISTGAAQRGRHRVTLPRVWWDTPRRLSQLRVCLEHQQSASRAPLSTALNPSAPHPLLDPHPDVLHSEPGSVHTAAPLHLGSVSPCPTTLSLPGPGSLLHTAARGAGVQLLTPAPGHRQSKPGPQPPQPCHPSSLLPHPIHCPPSRVRPSLGHQPPHGAPQALTWKWPPEPHLLASQHPSPSSGQAGQQPSSEDL